MDGRGRSIEYVPMLLPPSVDVASDIEEYRSGYVSCDTGTGTAVVHCICNIPYLD
jgi:hypothetical protein